MSETEWKMVRSAMIVVFVLICLTTFAIYQSHVQDDLSTETSTSTEILTETEKPSEIVTESVSEQEDIDLTDTYFMGERMHYSKPYEIVEYPLAVDNGLVFFRGHAEVWYSVKEKVGYTTEYDIPGKHVADDGTIRDKDGYICVASKDLPKGHTLLTSLGPGKVYDKWETSRSIGIYTDWEEK